MEINSVNIFATGPSFGKLDLNWNYAGFILFLWKYKSKCASLNRITKIRYYQITGIILI